MGSKLGSINVQGGDVGAIAALVPECVAREVAQGWVTLASDGFEWGKTHELARKLSEDVAASVMSVEYFDDDYVEFAVFEAGKLVAKHVPEEFEGFPRKTGNANRFSIAFHRGQADAKDLKIAFRETDPEVAVKLIESVLGCPIWVDEETIAYAEPPSRRYFDDYAARFAAKRKAQNGTKLVLCDSREACFGMRMTYPIVYRKDNRYSRAGDEQEVWDIDGNGKLYCRFRFTAIGSLERRIQMGFGVVAMIYSASVQQNVVDTVHVYSDSGEWLDSVPSAKLSSSGYVFALTLVDECRFVCKASVNAGAGGGSREVLVVYNFREHRIEHDCVGDEHRDGDGIVESVDDPLAQAKQHQFPEYGYVLFLGSAGGIGFIYQCSSSGILIADENYNVISRHRVKGEIGCVVNKSGKCFLLTFTTEKTSRKLVDGKYTTEIEKQSGTYVYEIRRAS